MLFTLSFIFLFSIGGLTGLVQGAAATDIHVHDTQFIVGHFHYVILGGSGFAFFAAMAAGTPAITNNTISGQSAANRIGTCR